MLFINVYILVLHQCHFTTLKRQSTHIKKRTTSPLPKSKSLFFSALIALKPAQWALLRVQRYIFYVEYTSTAHRLVTLFNNY